MGQALIASMLWVAVKGETDAALAIQYTVHVQLAVSALVTRQSSSSFVKCKSDWLIVFQDFFLFLK